MLWHILLRQDWKHPPCGVVGLGFLDKKSRKALTAEAHDAAGRLHRRHCHHKGQDEPGDFLLSTSDIYSIGCRGCLPCLASSSLSPLTYDDGIVWSRRVVGNSS